MAGNIKKNEPPPCPYYRCNGSPQGVQGHLMRWVNSRKKCGRSWLHSAKYSAQCWNECYQCYLLVKISNHILPMFLFVITSFSNYIHKTNINLIGIFTSLGPTDISRSLVTLSKTRTSFFLYSPSSCLSRLCCLLRLRSICHTRVFSKTWIIYEAFSQRLSFYQALQHNSSSLSSNKNSS